MFINPINLNHFFQKGFALSQISASLADALLILARQQEFVVCDGVYKEEKGLVAPLMANWTSPLLAMKYDGQIPSTFSELQNRIQASGFLDWFEVQFGKFSQFSVMINQYAENKGMVWHTDHMDATFLSILIYLTSDTFSEEDGGYLEVGCVPDVNLVSDARVSSDDRHLVCSVDKILPNHGTVVVVNNMMVPTVHRVEKLRTSKERYTVLCHFGFWEHTMKNRSRLVTK